MDLTEKARRIKRISKVVVDTFDTDDWHIIETQFPGGEAISNHGRLFRAMSFGDEDYPYCVVDILNKLVEFDERNLSRLESYIANEERVSPVGISSDSAMRRCHIFISHKAEEKAFASALKDSLASFGICGFVAHEDIEVTSFWEAEIEEHLNDCDGFIYLSTELANTSDWCQQEIGWALGRGVPIVALSIDSTPRAFLGQRQATWIRGRSWAEAAQDIFDVFSKSDNASGLVANGLIELLEESQSYDESDRIVKLLQRIPRLTSSQGMRLRVCIEANDQVRNANHQTLPSAIDKLINEKTDL